MAVELKRTKDVQVNGIKMLVYGQAGAGKTTLIKTLPNPIIISAEAGLLSLQDADLPYIEVNTMDDLKEAYGWLTSEEGEEFQSVAIDSISEIAEVVLNHEKTVAKDPRQAYGEMLNQTQELIRAFRDLQGRHVLMTAKLEKTNDEMGRVLYSASMPGNKLGQALPFFFDEVFAMRIEKDSEGDVQRSLQCVADGLWQAKDRSGRLDAYCEPDLGEIIKKIGGENE